MANFQNISLPYAALFTKPTNINPFLLLVIGCIILTHTSLANALDDTPNLPLSEMQQFSRVINQIKSHYVKDVNDKELFVGAVRGMLSGIDPHSAYIEEEDYKKINFLSMADKDRKSLQKEGFVVDEQQSRSRANPLNNIDTAWIKHVEKNPEDQPLILATVGYTCPESGCPSKLKRNSTIYKKAKTLCQTEISRNERCQKLELVSIESGSIYALFSIPPSSNIKITALTTAPVIDPCPCFNLDIITSALSGQKECAYRDEQVYTSLISSDRSFAFQTDKLEGGKGCINSYGDGQNSTLEGLQVQSCLDIIQRAQDSLSCAP